MTRPALDSISAAAARRRGAVFAATTAALLLLAPAAGASVAWASGPGAWAPTASMLTPRAGGTATLLPSGKVLVAGGLDDDDFESLAAAELYDPGAGTWTATGSLNVARD